MDTVAVNHRSFCYLNASNVFGSVFGCTHWYMLCEYFVVGHFYLVYTGPVKCENHSAGADELGLWFVFCLHVYHVCLS